MDRWVYAFGLLILWCLSALALAQTQPLDASIDADSAPEAVAAVEQQLREQIEQEGFAALRPTLERMIERTDLPIDFRSRVLRLAMRESRDVRDGTFQEPAERAYADLVDQLPPGPERSSLMHGMGTMEFDRGRFAEAEALFIAADEQAQGRPEVERANLLSALGAARAQQGNLDGALETMLSAYGRFEQTEAGPSPNLLRNIGGLSIYLEDYEQAIDFTMQAIEALGPEHEETPGAYSNLAAALTEVGRPADALRALEDGIAVADRQGVPNSSLMNNLGYLLREQGRFAESLERFERTAEINRAQGDPSGLAVSEKNIGETLIELGRREQAAEAFDRSLALYREADLKPKRLELYPVMVGNLEALGRYPQALELMREWRALAEELASVDVQARIAELQTVFDLQRREGELAALQADQARQRLVRWGLVIGVGILALFLLVLGRTLRMRTRANLLLADKNAEIDVQREALARANSLLQRLSHVDELTGLENRRSVRRLIAPDTPGPLQRSSALVLLIDLDRFKQINDRFGHPVGDRVLTQFAAVLREVAEPDDVLARWGGEEFLWLVADADFDQAQDRCTRLLERVRTTTFELEGQRIGVTCSIGAASAELRCDEPLEEFALALKLADAALYEAKQSGRDRWVAFDRRADEASVYAGTLDPVQLVERNALVRING